MDIFQFLFLNTYGKYVLAILLAGIAILVDYISSRNVEFVEQLFKAPTIKAGTANWSMLFIGLICGIPQYYYSYEKLAILVPFLVIFFIIVLGCSRVTGMGQAHQGARNLAKLARAGSPVILAVVSFAIFIIIDSGIIYK